MIPRCVCVTASSEAPSLLPSLSVQRQPHTPVLPAPSVRQSGGHLQPGSPGQMLTPAIIVLPFPSKGPHIIIYSLEVEKEGNLLKFWLLDVFVEVCHRLCVCVCVSTFSSSILKMSPLVSHPRMSALFWMQLSFQEPGLILFSAIFTTDCISVNNEIQNLRVREIRGASSQSFQNICTRPR